MKTPRDFLDCPAKVDITLAPVGEGGSPPKYGFGGWVSASNPDSTKQEQEAGLEFIKVAVQPESKKNGSGNDGAPIRRQHP